MAEGIIEVPPLWCGKTEIAVIGMGLSLPGKAISTKELLAHIDRQFNLEIAHRGRVYAEKLNIKHRYLCRDLEQRVEGPRAGHRNPELAAKAVKAAIEEAGLKIDDIGYLIGHTATPATPIPSNIAFVADELNYRGPHMELRQACTGFVNALVVAEGLLKDACAKPIVIVGSETGSVFFDPARLNDDAGQLVNLVQMGDAAAAIVLAPVGSHYARSAQQPGTLSNMYFGQTGCGRQPGFALLAGGSDQPSAPFGIPEFSHAFANVKTNGPELFLMGLKAAASCGVTMDDVDHILPHQANGLMDILMEKHVGVDRGKVIVNADQVGNTGSAAIWLALAQTRLDMRPGEKLLALGAEATKYMFGGFMYHHA